MLTLRPVFAEDRRWLYEWSCRDYWVGRRFGADKLFDEYENAIRASVVRHWVIEAPGIVGQAMCYRVQYELGIAQVAVDVLPEFRLCGFASAALSLLVDDVFGSLPIRKLYGHRLVPTGTAPVLGSTRGRFELEAILPRRERVRGEPHDLCIWAVRQN